MTEDQRRPTRRPVENVKPFGTLADLALCPGSTSSSARHGELFEIDLVPSNKRRAGEDAMDLLSLSRSE